MNPLTPEERARYESIPRSVRPVSSLLMVYALLVAVHGVVEWVRLHKFFYFSGGVMVALFIIQASNGLVKLNKRSWWLVVVLGTLWCARLVVGIFGSLLMARHGRPDAIYRAVYYVPLLLLLLPIVARLLTAENRAFFGIGKAASPQSAPAGPFQETNFPEAAEQPLHY